MTGKQEEAYNYWKKALTINDDDYKDNVIHSILSYDIEHGHVEKVCDHVDEIIHIKDSMLSKLKNDTIKDLQLRFDHEVILRKQEKITSYWRIGGLAAAVLCSIYSSGAFGSICNHDQALCGTYAAFDRCSNI